jgi:hypothetical protein
MGIIFMLEAISNERARVLPSTPASLSTFASVPEYDGQRCFVIA